MHINVCECQRGSQSSPVNNAINHWIHPHHVSVLGIQNEKSARLAYALIKIVHKFTIIGQVNELKIHSTYERKHKTPTPFYRSTNYSPAMKWDLRSKRARKKKSQQQQQHHTLCIMGTNLCESNKCHFGRESNGVALNSIRILIRWLSFSSSLVWTFFFIASTFQ